MTGTMLNKHISQISVAYKLIEICDAVINYVSSKDQNKTTLQGTSFASDKTV